MDVDLYAFFGISEESSAGDVKKAYKDKARQLHPDKNKDNPRAKEEFQQLKDFYDILHDPVTRKEYDRKWKAKRESIRRHQSLDVERRKLKEKLEKREAQARLAREHQRQTSATSAVADQIRREWQRHTEQIETEARLERKRRREEQLLRSCESDSKIGVSSDYLVRVKWNHSENPEVSAMYTKDFLLTCLSEYGDVSTLMLGKRGSAVAEFTELSDAKAAIEASERGSVGLPPLPLKLSFVAHPPNTVSKPCETITIQRPEPASFPATETTSSVNFDSFETDILARMANFT
ncbi:DnaJ subfamily A member 3 [Fasciola hepatica]|uniref:DnaJ subfamily A member 3 n=1 Tax=Fasciola hepatica TaxID=6192 RepID=A0A4E0R0Q7_FASHE|nr:DnaJ subfamily A member 3 [Fasciola hepatica]